MMTEAASKGVTRGEIVLGQNNYGKSEIRLVKVKRDTDRHEIWDLDVRVTLEGDFEAAYVEGDNAGLLATDTMRNTVYALAKDNLTGSIEDFGLALVDHFLEAGPTVSGAWVEITQFLWNRIEVDDHPHEHSFIRGRGERKTRVSGDESGGRRVEAGIGDVYVLKTTNSGWEGFLRERFTTLPETNDRILATIVTSKWVYNTTDADFDRLWNGVLDQTLKTFTDHYSPSAQYTLYRTGEAVLERFPEIEKIWYSLPNVHHLLYDLERFGVVNDNEIFHATQDPYGQIEGWVERRG
jgi:urate oxidase